jgi:hypothetical protein
MERAKSQIALTALLEFNERSDVFDNVGRVADLLYFIVGDSHGKNLAKSEVRNKERSEVLSPKS